MDAKWHLIIFVFWQKHLKSVYLRKAVESQNNDDDLDGNLVKIAEI